MPLIQFNIYYTLHINNNNCNNLLVIGLMLLIQFILIINVILLLTDFMLHEVIQLIPLIQFMLIIIRAIWYRDLRRRAAARPRDPRGRRKGPKGRGPKKRGPRPKGSRMEARRADDRHSLGLVVVYNNLLVTLVTLVTQKIVVDRPL